jgi:hypothetical protein
MHRSRLASTALAAAVCGLLLWSVQQQGAAGPTRSVVTLTLRSVFTSARDVPVAWAEVLVFSKDPATLEFFEQPRHRVVNDRKHLLEVQASDFPTLKIWLLYRIDESVAVQAESMNADRRRLYETYKDAAWVFVLPATTTLSEISINGATLAYTLTGSSGRRTVAGAAFRAPLPRYGGLRKGVAGYARIDHLPQVSFDREAVEVNRVLPDDLRVDPNNSRVWPGNAALYVAPTTLGGRAYFGPGERDKMAVERGYTPAFIVLNTLAGDVLLRREKPWGGVERTAGQVLTDLPRQDPDLWGRLPASVQGRYQVPARIPAASETRVVALWRRDADAPARYFVLFIQTPGGEEYRAVLFRLLEASRR